MADDPRRAAFAQLRHAPETGASAAVPTQLRSRRPAPTYAPAYPAPPSSSSSSAAAAAPAPRAGTRHHHAMYAAAAPPSNGVGAAFREERPRHGYATRNDDDDDDDARKGGGPLAREFARKSPPELYAKRQQHAQPQPQRATQTNAHAPPPPPRRPTAPATARASAAATSTSSSARETARERQRDLQMQLARMMDAQRGASVGTPASSGAAFYYELESPARPLENGNGYHGHGGNQADEIGGQGDRRDAAYGTGAGSAVPLAPPPRPTRRVSPSDVMQELEDDFRRSFNEHHRASEAEGAARSTESVDSEVDDEEEGGDTFDGRANGFGRGRAAPPVMEVRVQHVHPPFREELSSDLSDHAPAPHSLDADANASSEFPLSGEFDSIPSISLTPPASPAHRQAPAAPAAASSERQSTGRGSPRRRSAHTDSVVVFPTGSIGFLAGCMVLGLGGIFMEELMQFAGVFGTPSPVALSRLEQREMSRRLDLLQQELRSFRAAATEIEQQSQRMVQEVRAHLEKMKSERERHQKMISREMDALRRYVQAVTTELVEDEKKEIRKRLLETIADTIVELPDDLDGADASVVKTQQIETSGTGVTATTASIGVNDDGRRKTDELVEIAISAADSEAAPLIREVDEANVVHQVDLALATGPEVVQAVGLENQTSNSSTAVHADARTSMFSLELLALLTGVLVIAGIVGFRVRNSHRRKTIYRARKPAMFMPRFGPKKSAPATTDESDVETVAFFRSDGEGDDTDYRSSGPSDGEAFSEDYSEEEKEGDAGDDYESTGAYEESESALSEREDYDFHPADSNGNVSTHSEVESIDETPSVPTSTAPPTPFPRMRQPLKDRLADESPTVRRSPRVQTARSHLSHMR